MKEVDGRPWLLFAGGRQNKGHVKRVCYILSESEFLPGLLQLAYDDQQTHV